MPDFTERLREEIEYSGLLQKELAAKAGIKKRALDMYVGSQKSMPPADVAVKLAAALGVTVEYLVTGSEQGNKGPAKTRDSACLKQDYLQFKAVIDNLLTLPAELRGLIVAMIDVTARRERRDKGRK